MQTTLPLPRLQNSGLAAPTGDDFRFAVQAVDPHNFRSIWNSACETAGVSIDAHLMDIPELTRLANALIEVPGPVSPVARGLAMRVATYAAHASTDPSYINIDWGTKTSRELVRTRMPDRERMIDMASLDLFSATAQFKFSDAATRAANAVRTQIGLVTILTDGGQLLQGRHGLPADVEKIKGSPIEWAFCAKMVRTHEPYVINDIANDVIERTNLNAALGAASYAGVPLISSTGHVIGSVCVIDTEAREFSAEDLAALQAIADEVMADIEKSRKVLINA